MKLARFFVPVEQLSDREIVEQSEILTRLQARRRRRADATRDDETVRRLLDSIDDPDPDEPIIDTDSDRDASGR